MLRAPQPPKGLSKRGATDLDRHLGARLRRYRELSGLSQTELGNRLGLTFQQIQKYENGANRVSAARLFLIANILGVAVGEFFSGAPQGGSKGDEPSPRYQNLLKFAGSRQGLRLCSAYLNAANDDVRKLALALLDLDTNAAHNDVNECDLTKIDDP